MELFGGMLESHAFQRAVLMFAMVYVFAYSFVFRNWKGKYRYEAASCVISLLNSTAVVALCSPIFFDLPWALAARNTPYQNNTVDFSMAYFAVDMLHYLLFEPGDYLSILHHFGAAISILALRHYKHCAVTYLVLLFTSELTSPLQDIWLIARMAKGKSPLARTLYVWLSPLVTLIFTVIRGAFLPYVIYTLVSFHSRGGGDGSIPPWVAWMWIGVMATLLATSEVWVYQMWRGLIKFYRNSTSQKPVKLNVGCLPIKMKHGCLGMHIDNHCR